MTVYHDFRPIADYPPGAPVSWPLTLSADGSRLAWRVGRTVHLDGIAQPIAGGVFLPVLSADGRTLAYDADGAIVVNGVRGPAFDRVRPPVVSDDGSVVAYLADDEEAGKTFVVAGERRIPVSSQARYLAISPDGRRLAWTVEGRVYVDGRPGPPFDRVEKPLFSPDGLSVAYLARHQDRQVVVLNERILEVDGQVEQLHFTPDGLRLGCLFTKNRREVYWSTFPVP